MLKNKTIPWYENPNVNYRYIKNAFAKTPRFCFFWKEINAQHEDDEQILLTCIYDVNCANVHVNACHVSSHSDCGGTSIIIPKHLSKIVDRCFYYLKTETYNSDFRRVFKTSYMYICIHKNLFRSQFYFFILNRSMQVHCEPKTGECIRITHSSCCRK